MTAVITDNFQTFKTWCLERNIKRVGKNKFVDFENEQYLPIWDKNQLRGLHIKEIEIIDFVYIKDKHDLVSFAKSRIRP